MMASNKIKIPDSFDKQRNLFYAAFIIINLFLSCYYLDIWITPNTASRAMPVLSLYEDKTLVIDKYMHYAVDISKINDHYYSNKAPVTTFLVYPFYQLYKTAGLPELKDSTLEKYPIYIFETIKPDFDGRSQLLPKSSTIFIIGDILCGIIPFVIILVLSLFAIKKTSTNVSPVVVVMLTFYATFIFAYAGAYTSHILAGLFALAGYIFVKKKNYLFSGLMLGLAVATEYPLGILVPFWALLIYLNESPNNSQSERISKAMLFGAGIIPGLLIVLFYNYHLTGSILKTSYSYNYHHSEMAKDLGFHFPSIIALWGLTFSTYRGVLYYTPLLFLMLWYGITYVYKKVRGNRSNIPELIKAGAKSYLFISCAAYLLFYSAYDEWAGGWVYGPRYLIPLVVVVLYEGILFLLSKPFSAYAFYVIAGIGLLVTWMDKSTKIFQIPNSPSRGGNPITDIIIPDFFKHKFNTNTLPVFMFDSNPVLTVYAWPILFIISLIILTKWYYKLYPERKNAVKVYVPVVPLFILYSASIISQSFAGKNDLSMYTKGMFGAWKDFQHANSYLNGAQIAKAPGRKALLYRNAEELYKKTTQLSPDCPDCYFYLGVSYYGEGYLDSAISEYKRAIMLNPKYALAEKELGLIYFKKKQYDSATPCFIMSYKADSNIGALIDIGASYQFQGNYARALHYDSLVLEKDPNNRSVLSNLSLMRDSAKR